MSNVALYRKYRPKNFDEVSGQSAIVQTLRNQIINNKISHSYLFCGLKGSGKTSIARIFARAINCKSPVNGNPCCNCENCNFVGLNADLIEIDGASNNSVDNIRKLIDEVNYAPVNMKYKIYIIDEVHMLSNSAFNALLKTIEEPPSHAIFILATTEFNKIPNTIKSRCQIYNFHFINNEIIIDRLKYILNNENINCFNEECLKYIARKSNGSLRDAISILDQSISLISNNTININNIRDIFGDVNEDIINRFVTNINNRRVMDLLDDIKKQYYNGLNIQCVFKDIYEYYLNHYSDNVLYERYVRILGDAISIMERNSQIMVIAETTLIKLCTPEMERNYDSLVHRISILESKLSGNINNIKEIFDENDIIYYNNYYDTIVEIQEE